MSHFLVQAPCYTLDTHDLFHDIDRQTHRAYAFENRACDRLLDPPGSVGRKAESLARVELGHCADEADVALANQVFERHPLADIALGDAHDQAQIRLDEGVARSAITALDRLGQLNFARGGK